MSAPAGVLVARLRHELVTLRYQVGEPAHVDHEASTTLDKLDEIARQLAEVV